LSRSIKDDLGVAFRNNCTECQEGLLFAEKTYLKDGRAALLEQCTKCNHKETITKALIIEEDWLNMILQGIKSWEMRKRPCRIRGTISLIQSGSGEIMGASDIIDTKGPLTYEELAANVDKHRSTPGSLISKGYVHAWVLEDQRKFIKPIPYKHPKGAVIWVDLSKEGVLE